ncbi:MAG: hypothetical protein GVX78_03795 [Bacteroidetes bacterium]|jgi:hypothetical protein|nr:hypothetical protein [Bacteroidota bacterium]
MIPQNYEQWKKCIEKDCKINLTKEFAQERLSVYENSNNPERQQFISLYGEQHLNNIVKWYKKI